MSIDPRENPFDLFAEWFDEAKKVELLYPNGMALATADKDGLPDVRWVLLKDFDDRGFVFYTNKNSQKGRELAENPQAAGAFYWEKVEKQVRFRGRVEEVSAEEADAYFQSRPRLSRIGAWASDQSSEIAGRHVLLGKVAQVELKYPLEVPRPPHWTGFRVVPSVIEFWREGAFRLHDRLQYTREGKGPWVTRVLSP